MYQPTIIIIKGCMCHYQTSKPKYEQRNKWPAYVPDIRSQQYRKKNIWNRLHGDVIWISLQSSWPQHQALVSYQSIGNSLCPQRTLQDILTWQNLNPWPWAQSTDNSATKPRWLWIFQSKCVLFTPEHFKISQDLKNSTSQGHWLGYQTPYPTRHYWLAERLAPPIDSFSFISLRANALGNFESSKIVENILMIQVPPLAVSFNRANARLKMNEPKKL
jgi:hypothetical protein